MKKLNLTIFVLSVFFFLVSPAHASNTVQISNNSENSSTNVNVTTNTGGNTVCINGKCTTSNSGSSKSTVCINGKCTTSDGGDVHMESEDGKSKVNIQNSGTSDVKVEGATDSGKSPEDIKKEIKERTEKMKKEIEAKKAAAKEKKFDMKEFINRQLEILRKFVTFQFLFGSK